MGNAIARQGQQLLAHTTDGREIFCEAEVRREFSALILPYTPRQLSKMTDVTLEGARHWVKGERCPNLASLFNVAQHLPAVRDWVANRCGIERAVQARSMDAWMQGLYVIAAGSGPDALKARRAIALINAKDGEPEQRQEPRDTKTVDLFSRRRA